MTVSSNRDTPRPEARSQTRRWRQFLGRHHTAVTLSALFGFAGMLTFIVIAIGVFVIPDAQDDMWKEASKSLLQLAVITVLGGVVGLVFRVVDTERETRRLRDQERVAIFQRLVSAYHELRSVRREMKFAGFHLMPPVSGSTDEQNPMIGNLKALTAQQVQVLRDGQRKIADIQFAFDQVKREISVSHLFDDPEVVLLPLRGLTDYVEAIVREWQQYGPSMWADSPPDDIEQLVLLRRFLADKNISFQSDVGWRFHAINQHIRQELFGGTA